MTSPTFAPAFVTPIHRASRYFRLEACGIGLEIDARVGGRVVEFSFEGRNLLLPSSVHPENYGSTLWTSPQSQWEWPPPPEIDVGPYEASADGEWLVLEGEASPALGVAAMKSFRMDERGTAEIRYRMSNRGTLPVSIAPWEVTRIPREGLTFFSLGERTYEIQRHPPLSFSRVGDVAFIDHGAPLAEDRKLYADSGRGYVAHVGNGVVFLKEFERSTDRVRAPDEAELEIYANADPPYVELEAQGPFRTLAPGASVAWNVRWRLLQLPEGGRVAIGKTTLVELVESALYP
jgi:hypothetical protein